MGVFESFFVLFHQHASYEAPDIDEEQINKELVESEDSKLTKYFKSVYYCLIEQISDHFSSATLVLLKLMQLK